MTYEEQLVRWVQGDSICPNDHDECCPDFSCCNPELKAPDAVRQTFYDEWKAGNTAVIDRMLMGFLGAFIAAKYGDKKVHIAGQMG